MLINKSEIREVKGISKEAKTRIIDFLQGAIYCWCAKKNSEWFSARDFLGGDNYFWQGTPMMVLYQKHRDRGKTHEASVKEAGKDAGWILKKVIDIDKRKFETKKEELIRKYRWVRD